MGENWISSSSMASLNIGTKIAMDFCLVELARCLVSAVMVDICDGVTLASFILPIVGLIYLIVMTLVRLLRLFVSLCHKL